MIFFFFFVPEKKSFWRFRVKFWLVLPSPLPRAMMTTWFQSAARRRWRFPRRFPLKQLSSASGRKWAETFRGHTQEYNIWLRLRFLICSIVFIRTGVHPCNLDFVFFWISHLPWHLCTNLVHDGDGARVWFNITGWHNAFNNAPG